MRESLAISHCHRLHGCVESRRQLLSGHVRLLSILRWNFNGYFDALGCDGNILNLERIGMQSFNLLGQTVSESIEYVSDETFFNIKKNPFQMKHFFHKKNLVWMKTFEMKLSKLTIGRFRDGTIFFFRCPSSRECTKSPFEKCS